jgi:hypothetical protein
MTINLGAANGDLDGHGRDFRLGDVFCISFNAFGRHVLAFIILSAIARIPFVLRFFLSVYLPLVVVPFLVVHYDYARAMFLVQQRWAYFLVYQVFDVVERVCVLIADGAIIHAVVQDLAGRPVSIAEAVGVAPRRLLPLVGVLIALVVPSGLAMGLLNLPGFIVALINWLVMSMYFVAAPVCIAEQVGVGAILSRCRFLTKGHRWQIFGTILLVAIAILLVGIVSRAINDIIWGAGDGAGVPGGWTAIIANFIGNYSTSVVIEAFYAVLAAVFYYKLRLAKDGVVAPMI